MRDLGRVDFAALASTLVLVVGGCSSDPGLDVTALYVLPSDYNRGVGSRLYNLFDRERGHVRSGILEVWAGNLRAIDFYRRRGWVTTSTSRPGPQGLDFMTYRLPAGAQSS